MKNNINYLKRFLDILNNIFFTQLSKVLMLFEKAWASIPDQKQQKHIFFFHGWRFKDEVFVARFHIIHHTFLT